MLRLIEAKVHERLFTQSTPGRIGRFAMLEQIARGGMGTVYAAYDEKLDRKVAIKILRDDELPDDIDRLRFHREAQALARLSHPNVVTVHEVGEANGELFLAMEFIQGQSVADWLRTGPDWPAVLDAFIQAGRGLFAAHEAGLVHRDLKPHNLMRGDDGVVKVLDFGLARYTGNEPEKLEVLTCPGVIVGTPAYMSPEQIQGKPVDPASDQFSFCVALYEALYGERPFKGYTTAMLSEANRELMMRPIPKDTRVPTTVRKVLIRGLRLEPELRWPSMEALLAALSRAARRAINRWILGLTSAVVLGAGGLALQASALAQPPPCPEAVQDLAGVWDQTRSDQVKAAILGIDRSYAADVWSRTQQELDRYSRSWTAIHTEACEATTTRDEPSAPIYERQTQCLHRAAVALHATVDTLADADADVVQHAHELTAGLYPLSRCADVETLGTEAEPPGHEEAAAVEDAQLQLARAQSLMRAGRTESAQQAVQKAKTISETLEYGPIRTEVALQEGLVLDEMGQYEAAEDALKEALELASHFGQLDSMALAAREVMLVVGYRQRRTEEGQSYRPLVDGLARHEPLAALRSRSDLAVALEAHGQHERAEAEHRAVLSLRQELLGPNHPHVAISRTNLANVLRTQGRYREAEVESRAALALRGGLLGAEHPLVAASHEALGRILADQDRYAEAKVHLQKALSLWQAAFGSDHPLVAMAWDNLADVQSEQDKHEEAAAEHQATL